jgi:hypothetical protein
VVPLANARVQMPKPTDKLDAVRTANGPKGQTDWHAIDWRRQNRLVANLRRRSPPGAALAGTANPSGVHPEA